MSPIEIVSPSRRQFVTTVLPACAVTCLAGLGGVARAATSSEEEAPAHKFDARLERELTYRQFFAAKFRDVIGLAKALEKELGSDKAIEFLKRYTAETMLQFGQDQAKRLPEADFRAWTDNFRNPDFFANTLAMKIVEDTDTAFELKVTECLWASTFLDAKAGHLGYALVCHGDYSWPQGFNPRISMVRDKTLMQGHAYCNHRYLWKA